MFDRCRLIRASSNDHVYSQPSPELQAHYEYIASLEADKPRPQLVDEYFEVKIIRPRTIIVLFNVYILLDQTMKSCIFNWNKKRTKKNEIKEIKTKIGSVPCMFTFVFSLNRSSLFDSVQIIMTW